MEWPYDNFDCRLSGFNKYQSLPVQGGVRLGLCCQGLKRKARRCVLDEGAEVVFPDTSSTSAPATTAQLGQACGEKVSGAWTSVACDTNQKHRWVSIKIFLLGFTDLGYQEKKRSNC